MPTTLHLKNSWQWVAAGLGGQTKTFLNRLATNQSMKFVLDDMQEVTMDVPSDNIEIYTLAQSDDHPFVSHNRRFLFGFRREETIPNQPWACRFAGILTMTQDEAASDEPITHITAQDSWGWAKSLPVLNPDGSLPASNGVTYTGHTGDYIAKDVIANAYSFMIAQLQNPPGFWPWNGLAATQANLFIDIVTGHFDTTEVIPTITFQQGASVADAWTQLCQTGAIDIVLDPVWDGDDSGRICVMNVYNQAGSDRLNAVFGWDHFPNNAVAIDLLRDGTQTEDWIQFYAGGLVAPAAVAGSGPNEAIGEYGLYFAQKNLSGPSDVSSVGLLAAAELALRKAGKTTLTLDPTPELSPDPFTEYGLGDTVYVWGGRPMKSGITGQNPGSSIRKAIRSNQVGDPPTSPWRVYGFQIDLADDQVETVTNLLLTDPNTTDV